MKTMIVFNWMKGGNFTLQSQEMCVTPSGPSPCYILQGDNYYDTTVHVRDMYEDNQRKSLHYFNTYAVKDKPEFYKMHSTDNSLPADIESAPKSTFLYLQWCIAKQSGTITPFLLPVLEFSLSI